MKISKVRSIITKYYTVYLGNVEIGEKSNFYNLGGDSVSAISCLKDLEDELNVSIPIIYIVNGTVEELERFICVEMS